MAEVAVNEFSMIVNDVLMAALAEMLKLNCIKEVHFND